MVTDSTSLFTGHDKTDGKETVIFSKKLSSNLTKGLSYVTFSSDITTVSS